MNDASQNKVIYEITVTYQLEVGLDDEAKEYFIPPLKLYKHNFHQTTLEHLEYERNKLEYKRNKKQQDYWNKFAKAFRQSLSAKDGKILSVDNARAYLAGQDENHRYLNLTNDRKSVYFPKPGKKGFSFESLPNAIKEKLCKHLTAIDPQTKPRKETPVQLPLHQSKKPEPSSPGKIEYCLTPTAPPSANITSITFNSSVKYRANKCLHCGKLAIPGSTSCYSCNDG